MMLGFLISLFLALYCCIRRTNGLQITIEDTITIGVATTITYVSGSSDPSQWLLRNVYANGTTQIGEVLAGTGAVSFSFQLPGPHFLQAVAYDETTSTATSQPFYTGNLFTPVNASSSSSASSTSAAPSASCPTASPVPSTSSADASSSSSDSSNAGAIAGEVIGALGFLAALIFFGLWFRLYRQQPQKPNYGQTFIQTNGTNDGNGIGVILTPVVVTPHNGQAPPTQRIASWMRRLYRPSKYLDEADMEEANIEKDSDTTRSMR